MNLKQHLTVIILTYNEENNILACLDSMDGIEANYFVVDSFSTDKTLSLLKERGITYAQNKFINYSNQRNWAQRNNPFQTEWVLQVDAGERISSNMVEWIVNEFNPINKNFNGYMFARKAIFMGKWIRYGGYHPIYHLRLFRKDKGKCEDKVYDQHFVVDGNVKTCKDNISFEDTVADNLKEFTIKHIKWAVFEATETILNEQNRGEVKENLLGNPIERRRWLKNNIFQKMPLFMRSFFYFFYRYFFKLGFLDGAIGLIFHVLQGFWFRFLVDAIILEIRTAIETKSLEEVLEENYQIKADLLIQNRSETGLVVVGN